MTSYQLNDISISSRSVSLTELLQLGTVTKSSCTDQLVSVRRYCNKPNKRSYIRKCETGPLIATEVPVITSTRTPVTRAEKKKKSLIMNAYYYLLHTQHLGDPGGLHLQPMQPFFEATQGYDNIAIMYVSVMRSGHEIFFKLQPPFLNPGSPTAQQVLSMVATCTYS